MFAQACIQTSPCCHAQEPCPSTTDITYPGHAPAFQGTDMNALTSTLAHLFIGLGNILLENPVTKSPISPGTGRIFVKVGNLLHDISMPERSL